MRELSTKTAIILILVLFIAGVGVSAMLYDLRYSIPELFVPWQIKLAFACSVFILALFIYSNHKFEPLLWFKGLVVILIFWVLLALGNGLVFYFFLNRSQLFLLECFRNALFDYTPTFIFQVLLSPMLAYPILIHSMSHEDEEVPTEEPEEEELTEAFDPEPQMDDSLRDLLEKSRQEKIDALENIWSSEPDISELGLLGETDEFSDIGGIDEKLDIDISDLPPLDLNLVQKWRDENEKTSEQEEPQPQEPEKLESKDLDALVPKTEEDQEDIVEDVISEVEEAIGDDDELEIDIDSEIEKILEAEDIDITALSDRPIVKASETDSPNLEEDIPEKEIEIPEDIIPQELLQSEEPEAQDEVIERSEKLTEIEEPSPYEEDEPPPDIGVPENILPEELLEELSDSEIEPYDELSSETEPSPKTELRPETELQSESEPPPAEETPQPEGPATDEDIDTQETKIPEDLKEPEVEKPPEPAELDPSDYEILLPEEEEPQEDIPMPSVEEEKSEPVVSEKKSPEVKLDDFSDFFGDKVFEDFKTPAKKPPPPPKKPEPERETISDFTEEIVEDDLPDDLDPDLGELLENLGLSIDIEEDEAEVSGTEKTDSPRKTFQKQNRQETPEKGKVDQDGLAEILSELGGLDNPMQERTSDKGQAPSFSEDDLKQAIEESTKKDQKPKPAKKPAVSGDLAKDPSDKISLSIRKIIQTNANAESGAVLERLIRKGSDHALKIPLRMIIDQLSTGTVELTVDYIYNMVPIELVNFVAAQQGPDIMELKVLLPMDDIAAQVHPSLLEGGGEGGEDSSWIDDNELPSFG